uniref:Endonuclease/exonuclease/phosphatase domain-containing protein n=1 Tax=Cannabis sativa TaxID=3483 RepID=A0A803PK94_CANSA
MVVTRRTTISTSLGLPQDPMMADPDVHVPPTMGGIGELAIGEPHLDLEDDIELARLREVIGQVTQIRQEEPRTAGCDGFSQQTRKFLRLMDDHEDILQAHQEELITIKMRSLKHKDNLPLLVVSQILPNKPYGRTSQSLTPRSVGGRPDIPRVEASWSVKCLPGCTIYRHTWGKGHTLYLPKLLAESLIRAWTRVAQSTIISWNVRGLNSINKQEAMMDVCRIREVGVGALLETKMRGNNVQEMVANKFRGWDSYTSPTIEGRILIIWKKVFATVIVIAEANQYVHCYIKLANHTEAFCATFVYGLNKVEDRKELWRGLGNLRFPVKPWIILGDFNDLFHYEDRIGRKPISKNEDWLDLFPNSQASFQWETVSDHCVVTVSSDVMVDIGIKSFKVYNYWTEHRDFKRVVMENWVKPVHYTGLLGLYLKLCRVKHLLKVFNSQDGQCGDGLSESKG